MPRIKELHLLCRRPFSRQGSPSVWSAFLFCWCHRERGNLQNPINHSHPYGFLGDPTKTGSCPSTPDNHSHAYGFLNKSHQNSCVHLQHPARQTHARDSSFGPSRSSIRWEATVWRLLPGQGHEGGLWHYPRGEGLESESGELNLAEPTGVVCRFRDASGRGDCLAAVQGK